MLTVKGKIIRTKRHSSSRCKGRTIPISVCLGLGAAILLDTGVQICWKSAVLHVPEGASWQSTTLLTLEQPLFYLAIGMFIAQFFNWMRVLSKADLSFAQPITSLSYLSVCTLSVIFLHEGMPPARIVGLVLILSGVWFVSQTKHCTINEQPER